MLDKIAIRAIKCYQDCLRSLLPNSCRFYPSCSEYAIQAIRKYGFLKGGFLAVKRLLSCHPFSGKSGYHPLS